MDKAQERIQKRLKRANRVRKTIEGTAERPRLCVKRSLKHMTAQIVDDIAGTTLVYVDDISKEVAEKTKGMTKTEAAKLVGEALAEKALAKGVSAVVFDRKGYPYHGRVKAMADAAREKGLAF